MRNVEKLISQLTDSVWNDDHYFEFWLILESWKTGIRGESGLAATINPSSE
jgi:hypothetical protein